MKEDDFRFIEEQLARLDVDVPTAPNLDEMVINLVREEKLWTPEEYAYIKHFHQHYGFDLTQVFHPRAYEEWLYWHRLAIVRYAASPSELNQLKRPIELDYTWMFSRSKPYQGKRAHEFAFPMENIVPYDRPESAPKWNGFDSS